jgi:hypothetical protein
MKLTHWIPLALICLAATGCANCCCGDGHGRARGHGHGHADRLYGGPPVGPAHDRPFPLGQVTDSFWETQQTNAEAADFIFYDHEFRFDTRTHIDTAELAPGGKKKLMQVALRLEHVPFPVVIEESQHANRPELDEARRQTVIRELNRLGVTNADGRVVSASAFAEGFTAVEGENAYMNVLGWNDGASGGFGRRFGGYGGLYR